MAEQTSQMDVLSLPTKPCERINVTHWYCKVFRLKWEAQFPPIAHLSTPESIPGCELSA